MPTIASAPDDALYHVAKKSESVDKLIRTIYNSPSPATITHFKAVNNHLVNNKVEIGQYIIITPENSMQCTPFETDMQAAALLVDEQLKALSAEEKKILAENYQLINNIASIGGIGYGSTLFYFSRHVGHIEGILKQIEHLYTETYNSTTKLNSPRFFQLRSQLFTQLDTTMSTFIGQTRMGFSHDHQDMRKTLDLSSKSIVHQWKKHPGTVTNIEDFSKHYKNAAALSKTLKIGGYVGIGLDVGQSALKIHEACTLDSSQQCTQTSFKEGGRLVGSVGGGAVGGYAGYAACNAVFGIESFGTSLLWCGIVVSSVSSFIGGKYSGEITQNMSNLFYESVVR